MSQKLNNVYNTLLNRVANITKRNFYLGSKTTKKKNRSTIKMLNILLEILEYMD